VRLQVTILATCIPWIAIAYPSQHSSAQKPVAVSHSESKAYIRHTQDGEVFVTENASFDFVRVLHDDGNGYSYLLVLHTDHNEWSEGREGIQGTVTVTSWVRSKDGKQAPRWAFHAPGNQGRALSTLRMFQVSNWPCCSEPFENKYYSLIDGKQLYTTNGFPEKGIFGQDSGLVRIDGAYNGDHYSQTRYVGFGSDTISGRSAPTLQYGTDTVVKQRFRLLGHEYGDNFDVPKIFVSADGHKLENDLQVAGRFNGVVVLQFDDGPEIRIPIEDDVLRADKATLPPGYSLRAQGSQ
jgi:hypothetical protein